EIGIINGTGDKTFSPEMFLTREQAAVILNRTLKFLNIENKQEPSVNYCDFDQVSEWAKNDVSEIYQFGIMIGNDEGQFNPQSRCTTEEMIVAVMRVYELIK
ncbi:MAG: S-layer homology domain-containing protein, partial [Clostridia bacterium]|nr:S-layer homology domain-containing protein [Clostridia bacterium]